MTANPVTGLGRFISGRRESQHATEPLTREELALFLTAVQERNPEAYPLFLCLARTGLRFGEALALNGGILIGMGPF